MASDSNASWGYAGASKHDPASFRFCVSRQHGCTQNRRTLRLVSQPTIRHRVTTPEISPRLRAPHPRLNPENRTIIPHRPRTERPITAIHGTTPTQHSAQPTEGSRLSHPIDSDAPVFLALPTRLRIARRNHLVRFALAVLRSIRLELRRVSTRPGPLTLQ